VGIGLFQDHVHRRLGSCDVPDSREGEPQSGTMHGVQ
jgi:hypothetical protein